MVRVGVVGVGHVGRHHARLYRTIAGVTLVGIRDIDRPKAAQIASELGVRDFDSLPALLEEVDAVSVAVPTISHAEVTLACVRAGVHVLVEKPIAATVPQADAMIRAARAAKVVLMVGHVERFNPAIVAVRQHLEMPLFIEAHRLAQFVPRCTDVDVVLDLMIHDLDLVLSMIPEPLVHLDAVGIPVLTSTEDIANARLQFRSGAVANVTASRVSKEKTRKIRIFQRNSYISIDCLRSDAEMYTRGDLSGLPALLLAAQNGSGPQENAAFAQLIRRVHIAIEPRNALADELGAFVAAVRGERGADPDGTAGRAALQLALTVRERIHESLRQATGALS
jgi:predicted dehydrogenase